MGYEYDWEFLVIFFERDGNLLFSGLRSISFSFSY